MKLEKSDKQKLKKEFEELKSKYEGLIIQYQDTKNTKKIKENILVQLISIRKKLEIISKTLKDLRKVEIQESIEQQEKDFEDFKQSKLEEWLSILDEK